MLVVGYIRFPIFEFDCKWVWQVGGLRTNVGFLQRVVAHPSFAAAEVDTSFISKHEQELLGIRPLPPETCALAAALMHQALVAQARPSPTPPPVIQVDSYSSLAGVQHVSYVRMCLGGTEEGCSPSTDRLTTLDIATSELQDMNH